MGFDLYSVLAAVGLSVENIRAEAVVQPPDQPYPFGAIIRVMQNRIMEKGVATDEKISLETLDQRLINEREKAQTVFSGDMVISVWARKSE